MYDLTFWHGLGLGWLLGLATFPFIVVAVSWFLARWFDRRALRGKMSPAWIRDEAGRGRFVEQEDGGKIDKGHDPPVGRSKPDPSPPPPRIRGKG